MRRLRRVVRDRRGIALVHVLVLSIFAIAVAFGLTVMLLQRSQATARRSESNVKTAEDAGALARTISGWNANQVTLGRNAYCSPFTDSQGSYNCGYTGGCNCTCTPNDPTQPTVYGSGCTGAPPNCSDCQLSIQSQ